jgi:hypothetical protein
MTSARARKIGQALAMLAPERALTPTALALPERLSRRDWEELGAQLAAAEQALGWWLGDWWRYGEQRWGARKALTTTVAWRGPAYQTCKKAAVVCRAFERFRRRNLLSFKHHAEVAALPAHVADRLLDWAMIDVEAGGPRSTRELRVQVRRWREMHPVAAPVLRLGEPVTTDAVDDDAAGTVVALRPEPARDSEEGRDLLASMELLILEVHDLPLARVIGALSERQRQWMAPMVIELRRLLTEIERRLNR